MVASMAWRGGDLSAAFALAASQDRPLLLSWEAGWCPACNRAAAVIFGHAGVAQRMRELVAVRLDGDSPGAQALAARYRLRSYPTLVLFHPDGREITRLPCELDGEHFLAALDLALPSRYTVAESLRAALDGLRAPGAAEWSLLSLYSWDTDEGSVLGALDPATTLRRLAQTCPQGTAAAARLALHAQLASAGAAVMTDDVGTLLNIIGDAGLARANMDVFVNAGVQLIEWAGAHRPALVAALDAAARAWTDDTTLSAVDRILALRLRMRLTRLGAPRQGMAQQAQQAISAALAAADGPQARHSVLNTSVGALKAIGLGDQAESLLLAELATTHSPWYFMHSLAESAQARGDTAAMLDWQQQAWQVAAGAATRLQWGVTYLISLIELAPHEADRIAQAEERLERDIAGMEDAREQRNGAQLLRLAAARQKT